MIKRLVQNIILIFLGIILLLVGYSKYVRKDCVVKLGGYGILIVLTESMEPSVFPQELILIKECDKYELEDIVTYQNSEGILITHRILQIDEYSFIAKGDKNEIEDSSMKIDRIEGKVIFHSSIIGIFIMKYLKIVIISYFAIWVIIYVTKRKKEKQNEKEK